MEDYLDVLEAKLADPNYVPSNIASSDPKNMVRELRDAKVSVRVTDELVSRAPLCTRWSKKAAEREADSYNYSPFIYYRAEKAGLKWKIMAYRCEPVFPEEKDSIVSYGKLLNTMVSSFPSNTRKGT